MNKSVAVVFTKYKSLLTRLKKRAPLSLAMMACLLPFPLVASGEKSVNGTPAHVALVYLSLSALFAAFALQVYYSGSIIEDALSKTIGEKPPAWKKFLRHLPGNLILSMALEAAGLVPFFFTGYMKNERGAGPTALVLGQMVMAIPLFALSVELWFRYFRWHGLRCITQPMERKAFLKRYKAPVLALLLVFLPMAALPEWGWGLAVASVATTAVTVTLLECLGLELERLVAQQ